MCTAPRCNICNRGSWWNTVDISGVVKSDKNAAFIHGDTKERASLGKYSRENEGHVLLRSVLGENLSMHLYFKPQSRLIFMRTHFARFTPGERLADDVRQPMLLSADLLQQREDVK